MKRFNLIKYVLIIFTLNTYSGFGQNCNQLPLESEFDIEVLEANTPGMAYDLDIASDLKVYWIERYGAFKVHNQQTGITSTIHQFEVMYSHPNWHTGNEGGGQGLALDPNFDINHWVYIYYSLPEDSLSTPVIKYGLGPTERLSRFTLNQTNTQIIPGSEKVLFEHMIFAQASHRGGDLEFDTDGNLWLPTGDNIWPGTSNGNPVDASQPYTDVRHTSGNTNDFRGKILRIKPIPFADSENPIPGIGSTYSIPDGNMFAKNETKAKPEIYNMGHRNPFTISIHPTKGWVAEGEYSGGSGEDEINVFTKPSNNGWPWFSGNNIRYSENYNPGNIQNTSNHNTGLQNIPEAVPAAFSPNSTNIKMSLACGGMVGPWFQYNKYSNSTVKFPPYLHDKLMVTSFGSVPLQIASFDNNATPLNLETMINTNSNTVQINRMKQGPDGALYVAQGQYTFNPANNSKIWKMSYTGSCSEIVPACTDPNYIEYNPRAEVHSQDSCQTPVPITYRKPLFNIVHKKLLVTDNKPVQINFPGNSISVKIYNSQGILLSHFTRPENSQSIVLPYKPLNNILILQFEVKK